MRQSRARAESDRLTYLEAQNEHLAQLHIQCILVQRPAHPNCTGFTPTACVPDPMKRSQSCLTSETCRTNSHYNHIWHSLDTQAPLTCIYTHILI